MGAHDDLKREREAAARQKLEAVFDFYWDKILGGPQATKHFRFVPIRRLEFDRAWPEARVAVEIQGGTWNRGKHGRGKGISEDAKKACLAAAYGWRLFPLTSDMLRDDPMLYLHWILTAIGGGTIEGTGA